MTFATLKATIAGETGLDVTTDATVLNTWLNASYKKILGSARWPWLLKNSIVQTVADITTGTVAINAGSAAGTFSSGPAVSVANQYMIQFTDVSDDWYLISAHTAAATSFTLANVFNGASNITGAAYICRKVYYSFPSDLDGVIGMRQARTFTDLIATDIRTLDRYLPAPEAVAEPILFCMAGYDTSKNWQFVLYPTPNTVMNLQLRYYTMPADMTLDADTPLLPEKFHSALVFCSLYLFGHPYIDDSRVASAKARYETAMKDMEDAYNPIPAQMNVIQTWDSRPGNPNGMLRWPANFPQYRGY